MLCSSPSCSRNSGSCCGRVFRSFFQRIIVFLLLVRHAFAPFLLRILQEVFPCHCLSQSCQMCALMSFYRRSGVLKLVPLRVCVVICHFFKTDKQLTRGTGTITCPVFEHGRVFENRDVLPYISTTINAINLKNSGNIEIVHAQSLMNFVLFQMEIQRQKTNMKYTFFSSW